MPQDRPLHQIGAIIQPFQPDGVVEAIRQTARSGNPGDGKTFVGPVTSAFRIRTAESDGDALADSWG